MTEVNVDSNNKNYCSEDGYVLNKEKTVLVTVLNGKSGSFAVPSTVRVLDICCCAGCSALTSITIPNNVTILRSWCFVECAGLTSVTIPSSVDSIGDGCFADCTGMKEINVDVNNKNYCSQDGVLFNQGKTLLMGYPGGKQGAYTIPEGVTSLWMSCFYGCAGLTSVTIPNTVTSFGDDCFYDCTGLTSITIPNSVTSIENGCFVNCTGLTSVTIPNTITRLGTGCFKDCI